MLAKVPSGVLLLGGIALLLSLFRGNRFCIASAEVRGAKLISQSEILASVAIGQSIFKLRTEDIEAQLMQKFGCIQTAIVRCRLPNRLQIDLTESQRLFVWESDGGMWWVDDDGRVLGKTRSVGELVVVHDLRTWAPDPYQGTDSGYLVGVPWELARAMTKALPDVRELDYTREHGLIIYVAAHGWPVYLGHGGSAAVKSVLLQSLVDELTDQGASVEYIDLRSERVPNFELLKGEPST